jgi:hypothetical protein
VKKPGSTSVIVIPERTNAPGPHDRAKEPPVLILPDQKQDRNVVWAMIGAVRPRTARTSARCIERRCRRQCKFACAARFSVIASALLAPCEVLQNYDRDGMRSIHLDRVGRVGREFDFHFGFFTARVEAASYSK